MLRILLVLSVFLSAGLVQGGDFDHGDWETLLQQHVRVLDVGRASRVDYGGLLSKRDQLKGYLQDLSGVKQSDFDAWSKDEQLAFLLNAYNSWTVELILTKYPGLESIKDLGSIFQFSWKKKFILLLGKKRSLDDIEHGLIRKSGKYNDPRIHFAANCASIGCPALLTKPYRGEILQQQLEQAASLFLQDRSRNRLEKGVLKVSSIFKWYREDFEQGWLSIDSLEQFFTNHREDLGLTVEQTGLLQAGKISITFLDYDWRLNSLAQ